MARLEWPFCGDVCIPDIQFVLLQQVRCFAEKSRPIALNVQRYDTVFRVLPHNRLTTHKRWVWPSHLKWFALCHLFPAAASGNQTRSSCCQHEAPKLVQLCGRILANSNGRGCHACCRIRIKSLQMASACDVVAVHARQIAPARRPYQGPSSPCPSGIQTQSSGTAVCDHGLHCRNLEILRKAKPRTG